MGAIWGILDLKPESKRIYEQCQISKQKKVTHKMNQHLVTTRVLLLLHMDHMRSMHGESIRDMELKKKLYVKNDEVVFIDSFTDSRAYKVFNKYTKNVLESINVVVDDMEEDVATGLDQGRLLEFEDVKQGDQSNVPANVPVHTAENDPENVLEDVSNKEEGCCVLIPQSDYTVRYSSC